MKNYDIVIFGNYTKDTIISASGTRYVDGGGFNYGAHAAACSGLSVAAVTRLAKEDGRVIKSLESSGIDVYPTFTDSSTHMRLEYPTNNLDERILTCSVSAGTYTVDQFTNLKAKAYLINASIRHEVPFKLVEYLAEKDGLMVADAQGFIRIVDKNNVLINADWPEKLKVLSLIDILKADIVEAESLTGESDLHKSAKILNSWGPKEIVLTHRDGIVVYAENKFYEATFYPDLLIGRSGRGDTCIASYASKRLTSNHAESITWSAAVTSLKMEAEGPIKRSVADINDLIAKKYSN
ncbi:MAG: PfkB family carbohydrate kinase [Candidatus Neomarinimicrobiota bacterium]